MSHTEESLDRATSEGPRPDRRWVRGDPPRANRAVTIAVVAVAVVVAVGVALLVFAVRGPVADDGVDLAPRDERGPAPDEQAPRSPDGEPAPDPAAAPDRAGDPEPFGPPEPAVDAAPAEPARIEVRDQRLHLVDADGRTLRTLRDAHDGSQEYTLRTVTLRPGSTTQDLAVAFVEGYMTGTLSVLVVRDGGAPEVMALTTVDYEQFDPDQPMAQPAGVWSPEGGMLAWLEPDAVNRAVLRAVRWSAGGPAGDATPTAGIPVDPEGLMDADETRGLELDGWATAPSDHLTARAHRPLDGGSERRYTIGVHRDGGQLQVQPLARS